MASELRDPTVKEPQDYTASWLEEMWAGLVRQRLLVCLAFLLAVVGGILAFKQLPIDAFPDLTNNQVQIITEAPGMAPLETEQLVTIPLEAMMNGLPKVEEVRSISKFGLSVITVVFQDSVDTYFARQLVSERLQSSQNRLPKAVAPVLGPITTGMGEIYQYEIDGAGYTATDLKTLHDWDIKYQLRTVPGVNEVNTWGGYTQEYWVTVFPEKLIHYQLTLAEVYRALEGDNANFSGGIIEHESEQIVVRGIGRVKSLEEIENILIRRQEGVPVTVREVARVEMGRELRQGAVTKDGQGEVVTGMVMMLKGENSREVIQRVKARIEEIRRTLPEGVRLTPFYDQTKLVEQTLQTVRTNLLEGALLVVAVLFLFLGDLRAALIVASVIPISLLFSFMGMKALGISASIMSLGALDFGMIVDGSIVMVENTVRKLGLRDSQKLPVLAVVQASLREVARPILFGILIITAVYLPVLTLEGLEYRMFSPMVFTVCFALLGSLLTALTLVPVLCSFFLKRQSQERESLIIRWVKGPYTRLLESALRYPVRTLSVSVGLFLLAMASVPFLGTEFVPRLDEGDLIVEVRNLPSISLSQAVEVTTAIERVLKEAPEIRTLVSKTGRPDLATDPMGVYQSDVYVILHPKAMWRSGMTQERLIQEFSDTLTASVPGVHFSFTQPIAMRVDELISGIRSDVAVKIFGEDLRILAEKAAQVESVLRDVAGQRDLQVERLTGSLQWLIVPNRVRMAQYGVSMADVRQVVETAVLGRHVSDVLDGKRRFALRVKLPEERMGDPASLENLLIETAQGQRVPLAHVAELKQVEAQEVIHREFGERRITVQCNVAGRDIGSFVQEGQRRVAEAVTLPPGYFIQWGGQFENQQRAMKKLLVVVPIAILVIFILLMSTFHSVRDALLVLLNVPFSLVGGIGALWLRGLYLNVPAVIGFVALFGVAVLNGIVLMSTLNQCMKQGQTVEEAIRTAAQMRLRPVLMTALVAALGFLPMALSTGAGAEVQRPLATVVIGGLVTSTLLTLVVLPVLYRYLGRNRPVKPSLPN